MLNTPEPEDAQENASSDDSMKRFAPYWSGCTGVFNEGDGLSSRENEEVHYRKHAVVSREWERDLSITEYRARATEHLNDVDEGTVIELCQAEDLAVVKYNMDTGELGIARRDDGLIKTFFRPNDIHYVLRKVGAGLWDDPGIADGFDPMGQPSDFADDAQKLYLYDRLETHALELPGQAHSVVIGFAEGTSCIDDLLLLLARLGEYRFIIYELQRRILTEAQSESVFALRKKIVSASASFEGLERYRSQELTQSIAVGLEDAISRQERLWSQATALISDSDEFENSLSERQMVGFAMLELKVLQLYHQMLGLDLIAFDNRLRKCDIYLRNIFYQLAVRFNYREMNLVSPESFFWRRMAENLS